MELLQPYAEDDGAGVRSPGVLARAQSPAASTSMTTPTECSSSTTECMNFDEQSMAVVSSIFHESLIEQIESLAVDPVMGSRREWWDDYDQSHMDLHESLSFSSIRKLIQAAPPSPGGSAAKNSYLNLNWFGNTAPSKPYRRSSEASSLFLLSPTLETSEDHVKLLKEAEEMEKEVLLLDNFTSDCSIREKKRMRMTPIVDDSVSDGSEEGESEGDGTIVTTPTDEEGFPTAASPPLSSFTLNHFEDQTTSPTLVHEDSASSVLWLGSGNDDEDHKMHVDEEISVIGASGVVVRTKRSSNGSRETTPVQLIEETLEEFQDLDEPTGMLPTFQRRSQSPTLPLMLASPLPPLPHAAMSTPVVPLKQPLRSSRSSITVAEKIIPSEPLPSPTPAFPTSASTPIKNNRKRSASPAARSIIEISDSEDELLLRPKSRSTPPTPPPKTEPSASALTIPQAAASSISLRSGAAVMQPLKSLTTANLDPALPKRRGRPSKSSPIADAARSKTPSPTRSTTAFIKKEEDDDELPMIVEDIKPLLPSLDEQLHGELPPLMPVDDFIVIDLTSSSPSASSSSPSPSPSVSTPASGPEPSVAVVTSVSETSSSTPASVVEPSPLSTATVSSPVPSISPPPIKKERPVFISNTRRPPRGAVRQRRLPVRYAESYEMFPPISCRRPDIKTTISLGDVEMQGPEPTMEVWEVDEDSDEEDASTRLIHQTDPLSPHCYLPPVEEVFSDDDEVVAPHRRSNKDALPSTKFDTKKPTPAIILKFQNKVVVAGSTTPGPSTPSQGKLKSTLKSSKNTGSSTKKGKGPGRPKGWQSSGKLDSPSTSTPSSIKSINKPAPPTVKLKPAPPLVLPTPPPPPKSESSRPTRQNHHIDTPQPLSGCLLPVRISPTDGISSGSVDILNTTASGSPALVLKPGEFIVEELLGRRLFTNYGRHPNQHSQKRKFEWLVKWRGYSVEESTWEPESNVSHLNVLLSNFRKRLRAEGWKEEDDEAVFISEKILARRVKDGTVEYLLKWQEWGPNMALWLPEPRIPNQGLVEAFNKEIKSERVFSDHLKGTRNNKFNELIHLQDSRYWAFSIL